MKTMPYLRETGFGILFSSSPEPSVQNVSTILHIVLAPCVGVGYLLKNSTDFISLPSDCCGTDKVSCLFVCFCKVLKDCSNVL
jgi:hypothetical protein